MPCFGPLTGYYAKERNPSGLRSLVFNKQDSWSGVPIMVPCGQCIGCKIEWSRQWAMRCMHEKRLHQESAFITLTYSDQYLPAGSTLVKTDLQKFMKRLRHRRPTGLRFFACGEYGETTRRPHYHVLLLNSCFRDMEVYSRSADPEKTLYTSKELDGLWKHGACKIGSVTFDSCAYVARYLAKSCVPQFTGGRAGYLEWKANHYAGRAVEFHVQSRRPGLGMEYFVRYGREVFRHDSVVMNAREVGVPRFYDTKVEIFDRPYLEMLKRERRRRAKLHKADQTSARRKTRERFEYLKAATFKRKAV